MISGKKDQNWNQRGSLIKKPKGGWIHREENLVHSGVKYEVQYLGKIETLQPIHGLHHGTCEDTLREAVRRVIGGIKGQIDRSKFFDGALATKPDLEFSRCWVTLTLSVGKLTILEHLETAEVIAELPIQALSYVATYRDSGSPRQCVAFFGRNTADMRACYVLNGTVEEAVEILTTFQQIFEIRFKTVLQNPPRAVTVQDPLEKDLTGTSRWGDDEEDAGETFPAKVYTRWSDPDLPGPSSAPAVASRSRQPHSNVRNVRFSDPPPSAAATRGGASNSGRKRCNSISTILEVKNRDEEDDEENLYAKLCFDGLPCAAATRGGPSTVGRKRSNTISTTDGFKDEEENVYSKLSFDEGDSGKSGRNGGDNNDYDSLDFDAVAPSTSQSEPSLQVPVAKSDGYEFLYLATTGDEPVPASSAASVNRGGNQDVFSGFLLDESPMPRAGRSVMMTSLAGMIGHQQQQAPQPMMRAANAANSRYVADAASTVQQQQRLHMVLPHEVVATAGRLNVPGRVHWADPMQSRPASLAGSSHMMSAQLNQAGVAGSSRMMMAGQNQQCLVGPYGMRQDPGTEALVLASALGRMGLPSFSGAGNHDGGGEPQNEQMSGHGQSARDSIADDASDFSVLPSEGLGDKAWFHSGLDRSSAERLLTTDGSFLVRESSYNGSDHNLQFVLSGRVDGGHRHILLMDANGVVRADNRTFPTIVALVDYHRGKDAPLFMEGTVMYLRHPVMRKPDREEWFHGGISRREAKALLVNDGDFLVRESSYGLNQFVVSARTGTDFCHIRVTDTNDQISTNAGTFASLDELIQHHYVRGRPIVTGDGYIYLRRPVPRT